jgi:predicted nucleotide-binding protein
MTDDELRIYLANLAATAASNTEAITRQAESIRELRVTMTEGFESQARSVESLRESISYNIETMAASLELSAASQRTAAAAMELSASTSRNIDRLEQNIARSEQMLGILISEGRADRARITRLEGQN